MTGSTLQAAIGGNGVSRTIGESNDSHCLPCGISKYFDRNLVFDLSPGTGPGAVRNGMKTQELTPYA